MMMRKLLCTLLILFVGQVASGSSLHRRAALEMMQASGVPEMLKRAFHAQLENQFKAVPELEKL